ncbi:TetR family transcriptional regulator [Intrasporangium oryzae NRRL B-24470]|uniref:TetR family transcriptional regulator n=1 Tax=Intrasporangium oryzae NRRL B-24470 TaxID=1386089 RepID=W9G6X2_9MICO|nr:TetR/AcrR family transcriptional regulator [Intrasporangium oryzae]EWS99618.1 TetR family transcriptional regulator [Intrasporangium oryzae NRRL B-24470]
MTGETAKTGAATQVQATGTHSADPRVIQSRERVLTTTLELLTESGLGGLTMEDVAKRSGVAKTTIYRHWSNRNALIIDACLRMTDGDEEPPDTGSLEGDLRAILTELAHLLATAKWSSIMPSIIDAAEREPDIAQVHSRLQVRHAAPMRAALERAVDRGEISPDVDISAVASALRGPLYFRRWFTREPIDTAFIDLVVRGGLAAIDVG